MTQAQYARHRGVSAVAVHLAIKSGRISLNNGRIDPVEADRLWSQNSRVRARTAANGGVPPSPPPAAAPPADAPREEAGTYDYFAERARREKAEADIAEAKAAEIAGALVRTEDVRREWSSIAGRVRETLLQMPDRLAPLLEQRTLQFIRKTLDEELRAALDALAQD